MGRKSGPKLSAAVAFARKSGADCRFRSDAHRAQEDARVAATIAIHFAR